MSRLLDSLTIRVATENDVPNLAALRTEWHQPSEPEPGFADRLAAWWRQERAHRTAWLALGDGRTVGMVSLVEFRRMPSPGRLDARWGYVSQLYVRPEARDQGVGARLLATLVEAAHDRGYARLILSPSPRATPFFRRAGFVTADERSPAHLLTLSLRDQAPAPDEPRPAP